MAWYKWAGGATERADLLGAAKRFAWEMAGKDNPTPLGPVVLAPDTPAAVRAEVVSGPTLSPKTYFFSLRDDRDMQRSWPSTLTLEKQWQGLTYLFVVNAAQAYPGKADYTDAKVRAAFTSLPQRVTSVEALFEGRRIAAKGGRFEDDFEALGVRVYRW